MEQLNLETYLNSEAVLHGQNKVRVLFISLNIKGYYSLAVRILALMVAHSKQLRKHYRACFIEQTTDCNLDQFLETVSIWNPKIIGLSVNIWNRNPMFTLARTLKDRWPDIVIIAGGQEMTQSVVDYLELAPPIDFIIDGEGELPMQQFLNNWDPVHMRLKDPKVVSGLRYRHNGKNCFSGPALLTASLDEIPSPILAGVVPIRSKQKLGVMLEGSRGCPFRCSFCFEGSKKSSVRLASLEKIIQEFKYVMDRGGRHFHMLDPILCNTDPGRLRELTNRILKMTAGRGRFTISVEAYAENISEEVADNLRSFSTIDVGLQSINPKTLKAIHRRYLPQRFSRGLECLRQSGALFNLYLICGLPFETLTSYLKGIIFVLQQCPTRIYLNELCLLNGTKLRRDADQYGYLFEADPPYLVYTSKWMRKAEFQLAWAVSKIIERRHNLTNQGVYGNLPWLTTSQNKESRHFSIPMSGKCTWNCRGCWRGNDAGYSSPMDIDLTNIENADVEIRSGDCMAKDKLLRFVGQLHLGGAARIILSVPPGFLTDQQFVSLLINRGVWHFNTFYGLPDQSVIEVSPHWKSQIAFALENLKQIVTLKGAAKLRACVDISVFQNGNGQGTLIEIIEYLVSNKVSSITIGGDILDHYSDGRQTVTNFFRDQHDSRNWLKGPKDIVKKALKNIRNIDEIISLLSDFNLLSSAHGMPPCLVKNQEDEPDDSSEPIGKTN